MINFSVLMSVYKNDNPIYYKIALNSVTKYQTLKPTQVVVVFDGPVAEDIESITKTISEENKEIEFFVIKLQKNSGLANALNIGLKNCKYDYVARMDSDDIAISNRFEKQIAFIEDHPETDLLGGFISEFNDDPDHIVSVRSVGCTKKDIVQMAKKRTPFNHVTVIYKRDRVLSIGGYAVNFGKLEDYKLWVDMIAAEYCVANIKDILVNVRVGDEQVQRRSNPKEIRDWDNLQRYLINARIINGFEALMNKVYIRLFTYMPPKLKKVAYRLLLRRRA